MFEPYFQVRTEYILSSCCDIRYDLRIVAMFGSSLCLVVCRKSWFLRYL